MLNTDYFIKVRKKLHDEYKNGNQLTAHVSIGMDGCGDMARYNGPAYLGGAIDSGHIISGGFNVSSITSDETRVFEEENMASALNQRTILLIEGQESKPIVRMLWKLLEEDVKILKETPITITYEGEEIQISTEITKSQCDGKIEKMTQGRMSAFCLLCNATREEAHNPDKIRAGFSMDISTKEINERFNIIQDIQIKKRMELLQLQGYDDAEPIDFDEYKLDYKQISLQDRLSLTEKPMVEVLEVANFLAPLHCRLRSFGWVTDVMMRQAAGKKTYHKAIHKTIKDRFEAVKKEFRFNSSKVFKTTMFTPRQGSGTSDTGNVSRLFFRQRNLAFQLMNPIPMPDEDATMEQVDDYASKVEDYEHFKFHFGKVLKNLSVILNVLNCDRLVRIQEFAELCTETSLIVVENLKWIQFSPTVHAILAHAPQIIQNHGCRGLLAFSEEGSEGTHKLIKEIREYGARKMNLEMNLEDVMNKLWIETHPEMKAFIKVLECSNCKQTGHTVRSCPKKLPKGETEDDLLFEELTYDD